MHYRTAIDSLQQKVLRRGIHYSLDTVRSALKELGHPEVLTSKVIHLAGTNGKGSTLTFLKSGLFAAGKTVGTYTSPHISSYCERITWQDDPISETKFVTYFEKVAALEAYPQLTEFEVLTLMMFCYMSDKAPDYLLLETGLGGRLDATNVMDKHCAVITSIGMDHEQLLGPTLTDIAGEKAGIFQESRPVYTAEQPPEVAAVLSEKATELSAPLTVVPPLKDVSEEAELWGDAQCQNRALAEAILSEEVPELLPELRTLSLDQARHWGRLTPHICYDRPALLDGAHNAPAVMHLVKSLRDRYPDRKWTILFQISAQKDAEAIIGLLRPIAKKLVYAVSEDPQFWLPGVGVMPELERVDESNLAEFFSQAESPLLVTGSLYFIAKFKDLPATISA